MHLNLPGSKLHRPALYFSLSKTWPTAWKPAAIMQAGGTPRWESFAYGFYAAEMEQSFLQPDAVMREISWFFFFFFLVCFIVNLRKMSSVLSAAHLPCQSYARIHFYPLRSGSFHLWKATAGLLRRLPGCCGDCLMKKGIQICAGIWQWKAELLFNIRSLREDFFSFVFYVSLLKQAHFSCLSRTAAAGGILILPHIKEHSIMEFSPAAFTLIAVSFTDRALLS